jgi:hypothetical protein
MRYKDMKSILFTTITACIVNFLPAQHPISRQNAANVHLRSVKQTSFVNGEERILRFTHYDTQGRIISDLNSRYTDSTTTVSHDTIVFYSDTSWTHINILHPSDSTHNFIQNVHGKRVFFSESWEEGSVTARSTTISDSLSSVSVYEHFGDIFSANITRSSSTYDDKGRLIKRTFLDSLHYDTRKYQLSNEYYTIEYGPKFVEQTYYKVTDNAVEKDYKIYYSLDSTLDSIVRYDKKGKMRSTDSHYLNYQHEDSIIVSRNKKGDTTWVSRVYRNPMSRDMPYGVAIFTDGLMPASLESHFTYTKGTVTAVFYYLDANGFMYEQIETQGEQQEEVRRVHYTYTYY